MNGGGLGKVAVAIVLTPIVLIGILATSIKKRLRPETSVLLFCSAPCSINLDKFRAAVAAVKSDARVSSKLDGFVVKAEAVTLTIDCQQNPLRGAGAYRTENQAIADLVSAHKGWISIVASAPRLDQDKAKDLAARVCSRLVDERVCAVWTSETAMTKNLDRSVTAKLAEGIIGI